MYGNLKAWLNQRTVSLGFRGGSAVKNLPAMQETQEVQVQSLGWEDSLEEGMATHSSILAWRIPWTEEPGVLQSMWLQRVGRDLVTQQQHYISFLMQSLIPHLILLQPRILRNKLTQKDDANSGEQFIILAVPRQSLLLAKDPDQFL